jgi:hypothetical protein
MYLVTLPVELNEKLVRVEGGDCDYLNKWSCHLIGGTCKFMKTGNLLCG